MNDNLTENLKIFEEFVQSSDYREIVSVSCSDELVAGFLEHITLRYKTIKFFINVDIDRAIEESHVLASMICDYLGYDQ